MRTNRIPALVLASLITIPLLAQTTAELLQKGIYTQETAGDLEGAIAIYRQIVNSGNSPRDLAAQAQYRLAQSLLQKGDLAGGAQEFSNLARNYADYGKLISSLAVQARANAQQQERADQLKAEMVQLEALRSAQAAAGGAGKGGGLGAGVGAGLGAGVGPSMAPALASMSFDASSPVTVTGLVVSITFQNPGGVLVVDAKGGDGKRYAFLTASPRETAKQGWDMRSLHPGDEVTVTGILATSGQRLADGTIAASASTVTLSNGQKLFDRAAIKERSAKNQLVRDEMKIILAASISGAVRDVIDLAIIGALAK